MTRVDEYLQAATRENTRLSYQAAVDHFEVTWGGVLPATSAQIVRYLADYGDKLACSTLKQRLAALAQWHRSQGFPDPTKAPVVKKILKGIAELHPQQSRQAKPLQLAVLDTVCQWLDGEIRLAQHDPTFNGLATLLRNKALILVGFWRAFRADELCRMRIENTFVHPGEGMTIYLPRSKTDRLNQGVTYKVPMLSRLCPVSAYQAWIQHSNRVKGPVFPKINRWGQSAELSMHTRSIIPLLRRIFAHAGLEDAQVYSSHSLRRGFASWAGTNQWDLKSLMAYVGWKNMQSALIYIDMQDPFSQRQIESTLQQQLPSPASPSLPVKQSTELLVHLSVERFHARVKHQSHLIKLLERFCLSPHGMEVVDAQRGHYRLHVTNNDPGELEDIIDDLLQQMHTLANDRQCMLEVQITAPHSGKTWY